MIHLKKSRGRKTSSSQWLIRQLNDPYVLQAKKDGYRSRAAYKLSELDARFQFLHPGSVVIDLGAAPGGWLQVAAHKLGETGTLIGIDLLPILPIPHVITIEGDFLEEDGYGAVEAALAQASPDGKADLVLSDMAPSSTGHAPTDHLRIMAMVEAGLAFAHDVLKPGGGFIAKTLQGGTEGTLLKDMKKSFTRVVHAKPKASRKESAEMYVVALGYRPEIP